MGVQDASVVVEVWTDLGCPWCYVGTHRLRAAIDRRSDADRFEVRLRSFELNPDAPREPETIESAFIRSHGGDASVVLEAERRIQALARSEGLAFSLDRLNANTFDVHRLLHHAGEQGLGTVLFTALKDQFFAGAVNPFDGHELARVAESVGLDAERVRRVLAGGEYAEAVRADRREGAALGLTGVPFVVVDRRVAVPGAQPAGVYGELLDQVAGPSSEAAARD
ncbi:DsbA family oxidoreductase [Arthrobacter sp. NEB 688]|uniref:DsbA family oxidoreductase n=1 Tax=Arthrobacter sp. NEB 688 TaxID=904039 RepID=UPI00156331C8|nr:DsbA family oxidoreductase [Arthrobacter sp. NEB 688]QKE84620.1 DsbA family oxidoreductase [Arthrobacter sp. NEB 688]